MNTSSTKSNAQPIVVLAEPIAVSPRAWLTQQVQLIESAPSDRTDLLDKLADAHGLIVRTYTIIDADLLDHAPNLKVIARAGVGLDNIDLDACQSRSIQVIHTPRANTQSVVEYVTQLMLTTIRPISPIAIKDLPLSETHWHALRESSVTPNTCVGSTLGIIGLGKIGSSLARVASALGMKVIYHDIQDTSDNHSCRSVSLDELARISDVISIHVDGRASNRHVFSTQFFDALKQNALLINTSRGFVIDNIPAAQYAHTRPEARLILDVHDPEPITAESPFLGLDNVISTPHIASATLQAKEQMSWVVRDLVRVLDGKAPEFPAV